MNTVKIPVTDVRQGDVIVMDIYQEINRFPVTWKRYENCHMRVLRYDHALDAIRFLFPDHGTVRFRRTDYVNVESPRHLFKWDIPAEHICENDVIH